MRALHIANSKERDAEVAFDNQRQEPKTRVVLKNGGEKQNVKILKTSVALDDDALIKKFGSTEKLAEAIIDADPEIDMESIGKKLRRTHRLWVTRNHKIAYSISLYQVIRNPDGTERERNDLNKVPGNVNSKIPLQWTGKMFPKAEAARKFAFVRQYQIRHINGATFDLLYNMAKELHESGMLVLMGAGKNGRDPIMLSRGGQPYRGFLEGRIADGERYALILHLSDIELKGVTNEA